MRVLLQRQGVSGRDEHIVAAHSTVSITRQDVEESGSKIVSEIDIMGADGKIGRFWITVKVVRGRPSATVSCNAKVKKKHYSKELVGSFK